MTRFKILKTNWKNFSIDSVEFILNENKDYLDYTLAESDKITNRSFSLLLLISTILSAIIGFTYSKIGNLLFDKIVYVNFCLIVLLSFTVIFLGKLIFPRQIMAKGRIPTELAKQEFLNNPKLNKEEHYLALVIQEIENCQKKISYNLQSNSERLSDLKGIIFFLIIIFPIYFLLVFMFN